MSDIRHAADTAAQSAFRRLIDNHLSTGGWDRRLIAEWTAAESDLDALPELEAIPFRWSPMAECESRGQWGDR